MTKRDGADGREPRPANASAAEREQAIEELLPLVTSLARRYVGRGEELDDLIQVGRLALVKAVDGFDPQRGTDLASYAAPTILGEIRRHFRDRGWALHVPRRLKELSALVATTIDDFTKELGRAPTTEEIAARLDVEPNDVIEAIEAGHAYSTESLTARADDEGTELNLLDSVGAEDPSYALSDDRALLRDALSCLPERERRIVALRFLNGLTQSEIAAVVGISQMHVSRLLRQGIEEMRRTLERGA